MKHVNEQTIATGDAGGPDDDLRALAAQFCQSLRAVLASTEALAVPEDRPHDLRGRAYARRPRKVPARNVRRAPKAKKLGRADVGHPRLDKGR